MARKKNVATHIEGKSVAAKRFIRTLKNKIQKHMTSLSKNQYINKLDDMVNQYKKYIRQHYQNEAC